MRKLCGLTVALLLGGAGVSGAQVPDWVTQLIAAASLPVVAAEARAEGVANSDVLGALDALRGANVPAAQAKDVLDEARNAHREHGPVDNFGAFVQAQLASGKRGRELAAAIRAEHARSGKGRPANASRANAGRNDSARGAKGQSTTKGRSDARDTTMGAAGQKGRPAGTPDSKRPDGKGRPQR
jgi:hypothetical protein